MKSTTFFEVRHGMSGTITSKTNQNSFPTAEEAIEMATEFKTNPRSHNPKMNDDCVLYWQTQTFTIVKKTITTKEVVVI